MVPFPDNEKFLSSISEAYTSEDLRPIAFITMGSFANISICAFIQRIPPHYSNLSRQVRKMILLSTIPLYCMRLQSKRK